MEKHKTSYKINTLSKQEQRGMESLNCLILKIILCISSKIMKGIQIHINRARNRIKFQIKSEYCLKVLTIEEKIT